MATKNRKLIESILTVSFSLALGVIVSACGSSSSPSGAGSLSPIAIIYTGDTDNDRIAAWESADTVNGDVAPSRVIMGSTSGISQPYHLSYDSRSDTLIVGNLGTSEIKMYDGASSITGDVAPSRALGGALTMLDGGNGYISAIDRTRDILYVAIKDGVIAFNVASTLDGNVAPDAHITGASTMIANGNRDKRMFIDENNDRLYVTADDRVVVFDNVSAKSGDVAPDRVVSGAATGFSYLWGIAVDVDRNILYVADETDSDIAIFDNAATINGNVAPDRVISGAATLLGSPADIYLDAVSNKLYSTNEGTSAGILVWNNASTVSGDVAPDRVVTGASTGISNIDGIVGAR